jgi:aryl-alcohol dehydrogenase-like predicted oxidoreductase
MEYCHLKHKGIRVSEHSFGSWVTFIGQLDAQTAMDWMSAACAVDVNFFDKAETKATAASLYQIQGIRRYRTFAA